VFGRDFLLHREAQDSFLVGNTIHDRVQYKPAEGATFPLSVLTNFLGFLATATDKKCRALCTHSDLDYRSMTLNMIADDMLPGQ
jgi:hypothetical protein